MSGAIPDDQLVRYICIAQHGRDEQRVLQVVVHQRAWAVCSGGGDDTDCEWRVIPPSEMHRVAMHWEDLVRERRVPHDQ